MPPDDPAGIDRASTHSLARPGVSRRPARRQVGPIRTDGGFTLIELLVVVVIIGILIAIAIPLYLNYKKGANDKAAQSDLRNAINVLEICLTDTGSYPVSVSTNTAGGACTTQRINISPNTAGFIYAPAAGTTPGSYVLQTSAGSSGNGKNFCYDSKLGGVLKTVTGTITSSSTACPSS